MSSRPQLMVLYTNDAVEVRYKDGSRLHVLPCGTGFTYNKSQEDAHPVNGMEMIQQRCRYVTSAYRDMVLSALDFRNRFSEQPYLSEELLESDQVVSLYARIKEIAWPKVATGENTEILEDGSVCITSEDEFASLILSPHRRDFTVCYLSLLSKEKCRERTNIRRKDQTGKHSKKDSQKEGVNRYAQKFDSNMPDVVPREAQRRVDGNSAGNCYISENLDLSPGKENSERGNVGQDDLNISPITQASCADSPQALSNASGSPITPQNTVKDDGAKFRPFSTPTEGLEDNESPVCTPYGKTAVFNDYLQNKGQECVRFAQVENVDGSFIGENCKPAKEVNSEIQRSENNQKDMKPLVQMEQRGQKSVETDYRNRERDVFGFQNTCGLQDITITSQGSVKSASSRSSGESESQTRCKYCWLTQHISCDECPMNWSQVVKMARDVAEKGAKSFKKGNVPKEEKGKRQTDISKLRQINRKTCVMSQLPQPLPLSCPGQHLHKMHVKKTYDDGKNPLEDPTTFSQGRLKVLLIDGVIYRIVRLPTMKIVEIYPGDGSVLVSQGMSAHFFLHIIPHGDKLEERTYSIKSPPSSSKGSYSVKNLINRAHRFLGYVRQEENMLPASAGLCCWKHEEAAIVEPMSTSVLDECEISGYGKFTALSNGQIRIAFKDRTCLDMTCDFSRRIQSCLDHSADNEIHQGISRMLADKKSGTCRLLLPNGQYQMVNTDHPGIYKRYIDIATEWAEWVNSSPAQRKKFYKEKTAKNFDISVERELQKIQCFNYIVDNTLFKTTATGSVNQSGAFRPYNASEQKARPSILRNTDQSKNKNCGPVHENTQRTVQIHSPPSACSKSAGNSIQNSVSSVSSNLIGSSRHFSAAANERLNPIGQPSKPIWDIPLTSKEPRYSALDGFNSVREALLRTSSVIKDIDQILEKR
ncbi:uncharacterized protein C5orf34 homolog [Mercenaria mercenaria]|uniref:uncharacterized protein C5orf34 homolog n=1 Tax=Mercenaria mercenaria TaxID=6596 RepID=UPI00234E77DD|nr:uncharacterized protein C5orf34 homolog [Mercenaria mercenaria]